MTHRRKVTLYRDLHVGRSSFFARQSAFSLVELLVVIGIIALLVGILMPAIGNARTEAKRSTVKQLLAGIDRGLEVFNTDFRRYPESTVHIDPMKLAGDSGVQYLNGAHWLARAMVGHDGGGLDYSGRSLEVVTSPAYEESIFLAGGVYAQRRGIYIQKPSFDVDRAIGMTGGPNTGRILLKDIFEFPILYYKANVRAQYPFSFSGLGTDPQGEKSDKLGKYNLRDNAAITGAYYASGSKYTLGGTDGWTLMSGAAGGHGLGVIGNVVNPKDYGEKVSGKVGRYFTDYLSDPSSLKASNIVRPVNETSYVLISAGPDGIYGTPDDVTNFK